MNALYKPFFAGMVDGRKHSEAPDEGAETDKLTAGSGAVPAEEGQCEAASRNASAAESGVTPSVGSTASKSSKRIRDEPSKSIQMPDSVVDRDKSNAEHPDGDVGDDGSNESPKNKLQCVANLPSHVPMNSPDAVPPDADGMCKNNTSEAKLSSHEEPHPALPLEHALIRLTSRIEEEVLAACHDTEKGGEIVPHVFGQYRPHDWTSVETIDLLDE